MNEANDEQGKVKVAEFHNKLAPMNEYDKIFERWLNALRSYYNKHREKMSAIEGFSLNLKRRVIETAEPEYMEGFDESIL